MRRFLKQLYIYIICLGLVFAAIPVQAESGTTYVKDLVICYAESVTDAQRIVNDDTITFLSQNIMEGFDVPADSGKKSAFLGYRKTTKAGEAVTDLKLSTSSGGGPEMAVSGYSIVADSDGNFADIFGNTQAMECYLHVSYSSGKGNPILADSLKFAFDTTEIPASSNHSLVTFFSEEETPLNLYGTFENVKHSLYFYYTDFDAGSVASVFSDDYVPILIITPVIIAIAVVGGILLKVKSKK